MAEFDSSLFHILHFQQLPSPSNMYGCCVLQFGGERRLLVATKERQIVSIGCKDGLLTCDIIPLNLGAHLEVVAINGFVRARDSALVLALTLVQLKGKGRGTPAEQESYVLHVYGAGGGCHDFTPDSLHSGLVADCQSFPLPYTPFQLLHTRVAGLGLDDEDVFLLCGSDHMVYVYGQAGGRFKVLRSETLFPEIKTQPSSALAVSIERYGAYRFVAIGCRNGYMQVTIVREASGQIVQQHSLYMDGPITALRLFRATSHHRPGEFGVPDPAAGAGQTAPGDVEDLDLGCLTGVSLLVTCAVEDAFVYLNIAARGLEDAHQLPQSDLHDSVICGIAADVNYDGADEVVIGTYGQSVMVYAQKEAGGFDLMYRRQLAQPVHSIAYTDLTGDGVNELVCVTFDAVYIFQHDLDRAADILRQRLTAEAWLLNDVTE